MSHLLFWPTVTYFYPIGNTSAVCLTENLPLESKADVLLLACGDPRHILYTVYANETSPYLRPFDITCCDVDAAILARNALLFTLLAEDDVQNKMDCLWNLFYHMFVDKCTLSLLFKQCRKLIPLAENMEAWRAGPYGHFLTICDAATLVQLRRIWIAYLDTASFSSKQAKRFDQRFADGKEISRGLGSKGTTTAARSAGPLSLQVHEAVSRHFNDYWSSGITDDGTERKGSQRRYLTVNPTFAFSVDGDKFAVHYGTDPLSGFHLAEAFSSGKFTRPHDHIPPSEVVRVAKDQFSRWCLSLSKRLKDTDPSSSSIIFRMFAGDALSFCQALKYCETTQSPITPYDVAAWRLSTITLDDLYYGPNALSPAPLSFNVIDTSNILDHIGLVNILVVTAPLLRKNPSATLYTEALCRMGDNPFQAILEHVCGDLPTMSLLLGIIPSAFISQFTTRSNVHEALTLSDGTKQYHERLAWKVVGLGWPNIRQDAPTPPQYLCLSPEDLAAFLLHVYLHMFSDEDIQSRFQLLSLSPERMMHKLRRTDLLHYNRRSFALLVHLIKTRVKTDWQRAMELFEGLVLTDQRLLTGQHAYQELCCQLHSLGVYTVSWLSEPPLHTSDGDVSRLFRDWTRGCIPQIVTLVLVIPREAIAIQEPEFKDVGTPVLQCDMHDGPRQNWFAVTSATFGTLHLSGTGENRVGVIVEGNADTGKDASVMQPLWRAGAPLIITFSVLSSSVMDFALNPSSTVGLALRPTIGVTAKFVNRLGFNLTVFRTRLEDVERVFVLAQRPVVGMSTPAGKDAQGVAMTGHWQENVTEMPHGEMNRDVHVQMNEAASAIRSFTVRIDITDPAARATLADVQNVPTVSGPPRSLDACVRIGMHTFPVRFPLPIDVARAKLRIARRSSYIEVVVPPAPFDVRPEHDLSSRFISLYLDSHDDGTPTLGSIHRINLNRCPMFKLSTDSSKFNWCNMHASLMFSESEKRRVLRENNGSGSRTTPDVLLHVKQTLHLILRSAAGNASERIIFALSNTPCQVAYLYVVIARMCLDVGSHTVVADAFVAPNTPAVRVALGIALHGSESKGRRQPQNTVDTTIQYISTDANETRAWFHLLPRLTERCRMWSHKTTCAYRTLKQQRYQLYCEESSLGMWECQSPLCTCGAGAGTEILPKHFKQLAPYLTRAAFSPLFSVPYLKEMDVPMDDRATEAGTRKNVAVGSRCWSCGKEGGLTCSRCKRARYCSVTCQRANWKVHKKDCGSILDEGACGSDLA